MHKWFITLSLLTVVFGGTVYAHVSGAFGDFLVGFQDETTTEKLEKEIKETQKEIEKLIPQVEKLQEVYEEKERVAVTKLSFYNSMGLDTLMNFILDSGDIVDILANQRIIEKNIESYLQELNTFYLDYKQLEVTKKSLEGHEELLGIIKGTLHAREQFLEENELLPDIVKATEVMEDFERIAEDLEENLQSDSKLLNQDLNEFVTRKTGDSPFRLEQSLFNEKSNLNYYFRSDHIYIHFNKDETDVILIGVFTKDNSSTASLKLEAGFSNGFMIPNKGLPLLGSLQLNYLKLNPNSQDFYVEQTNGAIIIQPVETAVE